MVDVNFDNLAKLTARVRGFTSTLVGSQAWGSLVDSGGKPVSDPGRRRNNRGGGGAVYSQTAIPRCFGP